MDRFVTVRILKRLLRIALVVAVTTAVIGGTGRYMGATGQVTQTNNGSNTRVFADGSNDPSPNFIFDLLIPDL